MNGLKDLLRHPNYPGWNSPASDEIIFREKKIGQIVRYLQIKYLDIFVKVPTGVRKK